MVNRLVLYLHSGYQAAVKCARNASFLTAGIVLTDQKISDSAYLGSAGQVGRQVDACGIQESPVRRVERFLSLANRRCAGPTACSIVCLK